MGDSKQPLARCLDPEGQALLGVSWGLSSGEVTTTHFSAESTTCGFALGEERLRGDSTGGAGRMALQTAFGQKVSRTAFWRRFERVPKSMAFIASNRLTD